LSRFFRDVFFWFRAGQFFDFVVHPTARVSGRLPTWKVCMARIKRACWVMVGHLHGHGSGAMGMYVCVCVSVFAFLDYEYDTRHWHALDDDVVVVVMVFNP
jgi:hypothetical protein